MGSEMCIRDRYASASVDSPTVAAVDSAATVGESTDADAYLTDWHNEVTEIEDGDLKGPVEQKAAELEAEFTDEILLSYVNNSGYKP